MTLPRGPRRQRTTGDQLAAASAALVRARFHLDMVFADQRDLIPLFAELDSTCHELQNALTALNKARAEYAARMSAILGIDIWKVTTVAEIGSAVRKVTDHVD